MKLWKTSNKFETKDLAEKCMEFIAVSHMMELSVFNQRASEPARKNQCIVCIKKIANPLLACFILCGHTKTLARVVLRRSAVKTSTRNV